MNYSTSIRLTYQTRERLRKIGTSGDSYDDIINGLIDYYQATKKVHDRLITRRNAN